MLRLSSCLLLALMIGCGSANYNERVDSASSNAPSTDESQAAVDKTGIAQLVDPSRKIIYTADVQLTVKEFATFEAELPKLVGQCKGYLSAANIDRTYGDQLTGHWVARIPVDQYEAFLESVTQLGVPEKQAQTAQDVTEEYVDLEARIANKKRLETRILELLDKQSGEIKDVIEVERELARVRSEIESMEGRSRYLKNRTSFTTVTITAREQRNYVPPQALPFSEQISSAWSRSIDALYRICRGIVLVIVTAFPWFVVLGILLCPIVWLIRRRRKRRNHS